MLKGIPVSPGYAIAHILKCQDYAFDQSKTIVESSDLEIKRYEQAIKDSISQLKDLKAANTNKLDDETLHIFDAHIAIAADPELMNQVKQKIRTEKCGLSYALTQVIQSFVALFEQMSDEYLRSRASDLLEVKNRILKNAHHIPIIELDQLNKPVILAVYELTASQATQLDPTFVLGIISEIGGNTSHSSIIARQLGIPSIVGVKDLLDEIEDGKQVIMDAFEGYVIKEFSHVTKHAYLDKIRTFEERKANLKTLNDKPTVLKDGLSVSLFANIGSAKDLKYLTDIQADGIGLFRTELMYLDRTTLPSENELFNEYKQVLTFFGDKPVTIRTLDIGGDKPLPYLKFRPEYNPALGNRAVRLIYSKPELINTQLRALLRASVYGNLKVMFPMIATIKELNDVKSIIESCITSLENEGMPYKRFAVGIMVEIPSTAIMADKFAPLVDFFSIGTNDLIQYTFAVDRLNPDVEYLYQPFHPVVARLIKTVVEAAHKKHIDVSVCGEMAGNPLGAKLLVGLGIKSLSMTPISILPIKSELLDLQFSHLKDLTRKALEASSEDEVIACLH